MGIKKALNILSRPVSIAPLAVFRIAFGFIMFISAVRFIANGWVYDLYAQPQFFFSYWGLEWIKPFSGDIMYIIFGLIALSALFVALGLYYRISIVFFFLAFTYTELIDKTNYLNHYYFVSVVSFLMIWLPAHRYFSLDLLRRPEILARRTPFWTIAAIQLQLAIVYFYAGIAKLNPDWLFKALPLKIWLPPHADLPVIGPLMGLSATAYVFSWFGALYDLSIPFFLWKRKTRPFAYLAVIVFHLATWLLFPIGMFPFIMILATLVFFSAGFHEKVISLTSSGLQKIKLYVRSSASAVSRPVASAKPVLVLLVVHFVFQFLIPWRFTLYPDKLFWTEQGYRFSWRVMLMEKAGYAVFKVADGKTGKVSRVNPSDYLTPFQEKMMSTQPDMILQFAHFLKGEYKKKGFENPAVYAESYVSLNGAGSRQFIDPAVDLTQKKPGWKTKDWILPFDQPVYLTGK